MTQSISTTIKTLSTRISKTETGTLILEEEREDKYNFKFIKIMIHY